MILIDDIIQKNETQFLATKLFSVKRNPFLLDHIIQGEVIFPCAMMLEMMAECARILFPKDTQRI